MKNTKQILSNNHLHNKCRTLIYEAKLEKENLIDKDFITGNNDETVADLIVDPNSWKQFLHPDILIYNDELVSRGFKSYL